MTKLEVAMVSMACGMLEDILGRLKNFLMILPGVEILTKNPKNPKKPKGDSVVGLGFFGVPSDTNVYLVQPAKASC